MLSSLNEQPLSLPVVAVQLPGVSARSTRSVALKAPSALVAAMPLSMMPIVTPAPVAPALYAASEFIDTAPTVARYSVVS